MIRVIMHGCMGHMGRVITDLAAAEEQLEIVAGIDPRVSEEMSYPVFPSMDACDVEADVVIDFSGAAAVDGLLDACVAKTRSMRLWKMSIIMYMIVRTFAESAIRRKSALVQCAAARLSVFTM